MKIPRKVLKKDILIEFGKIIRRFVVEQRNVCLGILGVIAVIIIAVPLYLNHLKELDEKANLIFENGLILYKRIFIERNITSEEKINTLNRSGQVFQEVINNYPTRPVAADALFYQGNCHYFLEQYDLALEKFSLYVKKYKRRYLAPFAYENIGNIYEQKGNYNLAITNYQYILTKYPQSAIAGRAGLNIARCYEALNNMREAIANYNNVINSYPETGWAQQARVRMKFLEAKYTYLHRK